MFGNELFIVEILRKRFGNVVLDLHVNFRVNFGVKFRVKFHPKSEISPGSTFPKTQPRGGGRAKTGQCSELGATMAHCLHPKGAPFVAINIPQSVTQNLGGVGAG